MNVLEMKCLRSLVEVSQMDRVRNDIYRCVISKKVHKTGHYSSSQHH